MITDVNDSRTIANELRPVLLRLTRALKREVHSLGVTGSQVSLLSSIDQEPGITASALAAVERVSAAAMSGHIARLESAGLLQGTRGTDRRRVGLTLTAEGRKVLRSVRQKRTAWLAARLDRLDADERAVIEAALEPLTRLLETT